MRKFAVLSTVLAAATLLASPAIAQDSWFSGEWSVKVGAAGILKPEYLGDNDYRFSGRPLISFGRKGTERRFTSQNDNISIGLFDNGIVRAGPTGRFIFERDAGDSADLEGLNAIPFGGELGGFVEFYPTDWARLRGEVRHGIKSHDGIVADFAADAFANVTPTVQVSAGPRLSYASSDYFDAYFGVTAAQAATTGLAAYDPDSGFRSAGFGGQIKWDVTDKIETSVYGEYERLLGPAKDSSLVQQRGSENQFTVGIGATYRFDFSF